MRERVEERDDVLSTWVVGGEGGYKSQELNLVSCCLSISPGRFDDLEGKMALVAVRGLVSGGCIKSCCPLKGRTVHLSQARRSRNGPSWRYRHPRQDRGEETRSFKDAPKLSDDTISTVFECITDLYGKITSNVVIRRALFVLTRLLVEGKDFGARWGDDVLILDARLLVCHLWDGVVGGGAAKGVAERGETEKETEHLVSSSDAVTRMSQLS